MGLLYLKPKKKTLKHNHKAKDQTWVLRYEMGWLQPLDPISLVSLLAMWRCNLFLSLKKNKKIDACLFGFRLVQSLIRIVLTICEYRNCFSHGYMLGDRDFILINFVNRRRLIFRNRDFIVF